MTVVQGLTRRLGAAAAAALVLASGACGSDDPLAVRGLDAAQPSARQPTTDNPALTGTLVGAGASSQAAAMDAWRAGFQAVHPEVTVVYDPVGSGGGRTQFLAGGTTFAGTDAPLDADELAAAERRCDGAGVVEVPLYLSPVAVVHHVPGVEDLNLSAENLAKVFDEQITAWDDPALAADNPGVALPEHPVTPVHRSDESGTTENFTDYLAAAGGEAWPHSPAAAWPRPGGQSAQGTSGVVQTVQAAEGTIGYADASRVGDLGVAALGAGGAFVAVSSEAAGAVVDASPRAGGRGAHDIVIELDRTAPPPGAYPLVLVSYAVACRSYEDAAEAELTRAFLGHAASNAGQQAAADAAGAAPLPPGLRADVQAVVDDIEVR